MFSTAVKLANLDDYLESSQDCIVSLLSDKDDTKPKIAVMRPAKAQDNKDDKKSGTSDKATYISLLETKYEFISRYKAKSDLPMIISHCPGWICYSEKSLNSSVLPLLSKVRSAQQLQGILIKTLTLEIYNQLLFLYKFRLNNLYGTNMNIKSTFTQNDNFVEQSDVFHVAIMPCHDKKLESTRSSLSLKSSDKNSNCPEVDIVLATSEVGEIIKLAGFNSLLDVPEAPLDNLWLNQNFQMTKKHNLSLLITENYVSNQILNQFSWLIPSYFNSNSGGFCEYIIRSAIKELAGDHIDNKVQLPFNKLKNDILEAKYIKNNVELNYCLVYGFRAIQSISRKLNLQKNASQNIQHKQSVVNHVNYHLIEAMACPTGCVSGGGQILSQNDQNDNSDLNKLRKNIKFIDEVQEALYKGINLNKNQEVILPDEIPIVNILYEYLIHIDKQIDRSSGLKLPFLRNDFVSIIEVPTASSLKW
ncbi:Narf-like protein nuclear prelamin A recognition factor [Cryptosporidium tyzzeri]|nr:Narf-like protein nuclear prelamin A recognition factor [Cryptosporidium tyzzeri]